VKLYRYPGKAVSWKHSKANLFCGEAASDNILEQNVILDPRFLEDDNRRQPGSQDTGC